MGCGSFKKGSPLVEREGEDKTAHLSILGTPGALGRSGGNRSLEAAGWAVARGRGRGSEEGRVTRLRLRPKVPSASARLPTRCQPHLGRGNRHKTLAQERGVVIHEQSQALLYAGHQLSLDEGARCISHAEPRAGTPGTQLRQARRVINVIIDDVVTRESTTRVKIRAALLRLTGRSSQSRLTARPWRRRRRERVADELTVLNMLCF